MRKKIKPIVAIGLFLFLVGGDFAHAQLVFLARRALGRVSHLVSQSQGIEVATILLEANSQEVYNTAVKILKAKEGVEIIRRDDASRTIEFTDGNRSASMKVTPTDEKITHLMISCDIDPASKSGTSLVVDGVFRVCKEMGVNCSLIDDNRKD